MKPKMMVIAGPPGSGKSTAFPVSSFGLDFFNADDRAAALNAGSYQQISLEIRAQVGKELENFVIDHIGRSTGFAIETTLRTDITFRQAVLARQAGFQIHMIYINAGNFETCVRRVAARAMSGGHSASAERLKAIYTASLRNLKRAISEIDIVHVNDRGQTFMLVDGGFVNWTQLLLCDGKERLMTSAIGTELICRLFRKLQT